MFLLQGMCMAGSMATAARPNRLYGCLVAVQAMEPLMDVQVDKLEDIRSVLVLVGSPGGNRHKSQ